MSNKNCPKCNKLLPLTEFYKQTDRKNGASFCKKCFNRYCMDRWIQKKKDAVIDKGGCCSRCGYNKCLDALEFHHLDPSTKEFDWAKLKMRSNKAISLELSKCILVCSNCHREIHAENNL